MSFCIKNFKKELIKKDYPYTYKIYSKIEITRDIYRNANYLIKIDKIHICHQRCLTLAIFVFLNFLCDSDISERESILKLKSAC